MYGDGGDVLFLPARCKVEMYRGISADVGWTSTRGKVHKEANYTEGGRKNAVSRLNGR